MADEVDDGGDVLLHAEFGARRRDSGARYALTLTRAALHAQPLPPAARDSSRRLVVPIADVLGCHALRQRPKSLSSQPSASSPSAASPPVTAASPPATPASPPTTPAGSGSSWAYVTVFAYPRGGATGKAGAPRAPSRHTFRVDSQPDAEGNVREARRWEAAIVGLVRGERIVSRDPRHRRRLLLLVNPFSGTKKAQQRSQRILYPMMEEADIDHHTIVTERAGHASALVQEMNLSEWDGIVIVSGDGLLFEVVNGLMSRRDWKDAIRIPLGIFPCGSGNALAGAINHYTGHEMVMGDALALHLAFLLCRGGTAPLDLVSVRFASGRRLFSFLSVAWGFVSDVDIESERFRAMGPARFTLGAIIRLLALRSYAGRLSFLPAGRRPVARSLTCTRAPTGGAAARELRRQTSDLGGAGGARREDGRRDDDRDNEAGVGERAAAGVRPTGDPYGNRNGRGFGSFGGGGSFGGDDAFGSSDALERLGEGETNHRGASGEREGRENDAGDASWTGRSGDRRGVGGGRDAGNSGGASDDASSDGDGGDHDVFDGASRPRPTANPFVGTNGGTPAPRGGNNNGAAGAAGAVATAAPLGPDDDLLPPLDEPLPASWVTLEADFVLVLGLYQSHLGADLATEPAARADDGVIHLRAVRRGAPRASLVRMLLSAGGEADPALAPFLTAERVRAFRLQPLGREGGIVTVDGERVPCEALQAQVHPGLAAVMGVGGWAATERDGSGPR